MRRQRRDDKLRLKPRSGRQSGGGAGCISRIHRNRDKGERINGPRCILGARLSTTGADQQKHEPLKS